MSLRTRPACLAVLLALSPAAARAEIPQPVQAMIDAAIATGDEAKVATVIELARQTNPADVAALDAILGQFRARKRELAAAEAQRKQEELRHASVLERWSGKGQVGAFQSSGNTDNAGISLSLELQRKGIDWEHRLRGSVDYQQSNGITSREKYLAAYEPRYQVTRRMFAYALAQYESDNFQGFSGRYSVSGGLGLKLLDKGGSQLSIKGGPSWRHIDYTDGTSGSAFGALAGLDFDWRIARNLTFTQDANLVADSGGSATVIIDSLSTSVLLTSGLDARISDRLSTRLSYTVDYDSSPPPGKKDTDAQTRFTLVYGF